MEILDLTHVTLIARDFDASRRFFCDVLGMSEVPLPADCPHATAWFRSGSAEVHLVLAEHAVQESGDSPLLTNDSPDHGLARHAAFLVADIGAAERRLQEAGVPIVTGPRDRGDGVTQIFCYDPDRHLIELTSSP